MTPHTPHPLALLLASVGLALGGGWFLASTPSPLDEARAPQDALSPLQQPPQKVPSPLDAKALSDGRYREAELDPAAQLEAIGYLSGSREAGEAVSVTLHDPSRTEPGLNLVTSGHGSEALLIDMEGNEVHRWARSFDEVWPNWAGPTNENMSFWRRVALLEDGGLIAIWEGVGMVRLDRDSNIVWARPNGAHHDLQVLPGGEILVLTRRVEQAEELDTEQPTLVDYVSRLRPDGLERQRVSLLFAYASSPFAAHFRPRAERGGDSFHTNSLTQLDGRHGKRFPEGSILLSMRHLDTVAVLDPSQRRITWSLQGDWRLQHDPSLLANGHLLLFDNGPPDRQASRILEIDPRTGAHVWVYQGTDDEPFWSATCGTAQRLPSGNTLITESDGGRAFEVTPEGEKVWEYHNPNRPADHPELVATLFEVLRVPAELSWLDAPDAEEAP